MTAVQVCQQIIFMSCMDCYLDFSSEKVRMIFLDDWNHQEKTDDFCPEASLNLKLEVGAQGYFDAVAHCLNA